MNFTENEFWKNKKVKKLMKITKIQTIELPMKNVKYVTHKSYVCYKMFLYKLSHYSFVVNIWSGDLWSEILDATANAQN